MTYTLKDADAFYGELESTYGINKTWVIFKDTEGSVRSIGHCTPGACSGGTVYRYVNVPSAAGPSAIQIANPKDVVTAALPTVNGMLDNILATKLEVNLNTFALPVFMIQQAIASMAEVEAIGEKQAKSYKVRLVLEILGAVFAFCRL
jgi:hypothetical protein